MSCCQWRSRMAGERRSATSGTDTRKFFTMASTPRNTSSSRTFLGSALTSLTKFLAPSSMRSVLMALHSVWRQSCGHSRHAAASNQEMRKWTKGIMWSGGVGWSHAGGHDGKAHQQGGQQQSRSGLAWSRHSLPVRSAPAVTRKGPNSWHHTPQPQGLMPPALVPSTPTSPHDAP